jgi:hypothetical protein
MSAAPQRKKNTATPAKAASNGGKPPKPRKRKPVDLEARLDRLIRKVLRTGPEASSSPEQWRSLRETWRVVLLYPGKHVAWIDHYEGEGYNRRLVRRQVLCVSRSSYALSKRVDKILETMPEGTQFRVCGTYVEPPDALPFLM